MNDDARYRRLLESEQALQRSVVCVLGGWVGLAITIALGFALLLAFRQMPHGFFTFRAVAAIVMFLAIPVVIVVGLWIVVRRNLRPRDASVWFPSDLVVWFRAIPLLGLAFLAFVPVVAYVDIGAGVVGLALAWSFSGIGTALLASALLARRGSDLNCAECRYPVGDGPICPECGSDLSARLACVIGVRRPSRLLLQLGTGSLLVAFALAFVALR